MYQRSPRSAAWRHLHYPWRERLVSNRILGTKISIRSNHTDAESLPNSLPATDYPLGVIAGYREESVREDAIAGLDDGLVPERSTLIDGMDDFILIETGHSAMRFDISVAQQTIRFLKNGVFSR